MLVIHYTFQKVRSFSRLFHMADVIGDASKVSFKNWIDISRSIINDKIASSHSIVVFLTCNINFYGHHSEILIWNVIAKEPSIAMNEIQHLSLRKSIANSFCERIFWNGTNKTHFKEIIEHKRNRFYIFAHIFFVSVPVLWRIFMFMKM